MGVGTPSATTAQNAISSGGQMNDYSWVLRIYYYKLLLMHIKNNIDYYNL